jgi:N-acetylglutamate synthase-like GNAT family acetyltransferase
MTSNSEASSDICIRLATVIDLPLVKEIADAERQSLGFVHRGALTRAVLRSELIVAEVAGTVLGYCHIYRRLDNVTTLSSIAVVQSARGRGIGRALIGYLRSDMRTRGMVTLRLKCPVDLPANAFYAHLGFTHIAIAAGADRSLCIWEWNSETY